MRGNEPSDTAAIHGRISVIDYSDDYCEIRKGVRRLCEQFPGQYWRELDRQMAYPSEFAQALGDAGYLAALIPEVYGGSGLPLSAAVAILEEVQRAGCNGAVCHAQMYIMGTLLRHGSDVLKARFLPKIASGDLRLQAFGVTEPTSGSDTSSITTRAVRDGDRGERLWLRSIRHECGAHLDRGRMRRRREMVHRQGQHLRLRTQGVRPSYRPEPRHTVP